MGFIYHRVFRSVNVCVTTNCNQRERQSLSMAPEYMMLFYSFDANLMLKLHVMSFSIIVISDERVPTELKKAIMQARTDKKLTQSQLAQVLYLSFFSLYLSLLIITQFMT